MTIPATLGIVLDSNAVFDAWVFVDPRMQSVVAALETGRLQWWVTPPMREELAAVIARESDLRFAQSATSLWQAWDRWATLTTVPEVAPVLHCRDADDQKFIDLALAQGAHWLLTRDRALLDLARGAKQRGLWIVKPEDWVLSNIGIGADHR